MRLVCGVLTLVATVVPLSLSWVRDYPMFALGQDEKTMDYSINFYIVPWCRYQVTRTDIDVGRTRRVRHTAHSFT